MILHPVLGQFLILCSRTAVVAVRINGDSPTGSKDAGHLNVFRIHQPDQVLHDNVHTVFMEITVVTETEQIKFQALALHHPHVRQITDTDFREIRLSRNGTKAGELGEVETHPIVILRMLVDKHFDQFGRIIQLI